MATLLTRHNTPSNTAQATVKDTEQAVAVYLSCYPRNILLSYRYHPVTESVSLVLLRCPISHPRHSRHLLTMHDRIPWSYSQNTRLDPPACLPRHTRDPPVLSAVSTNSDLVNVLLRMRVSNACLRHNTCRYDSCVQLLVLANPSSGEQRADSCYHRFIPSDWRPPIWVRVLPTLENVFYGANISNILSAHQNTFLDIMAWLPYGIIHFGAPAVWCIIWFIFASPGTVPVFAKSFGWMNIIGVTIQLLFPCSPPWYENMYGLAPASYSIKGSPAGLARIDELFGIALYTPTFTGSPMVFGAFPSLHAGSAVMEALFMTHVFPRLRSYFVVYVLWLWWATMYLSHHYAVDLVGGSLRQYLHCLHPKLRG